MFLLENIKFYFQKLIAGDANSTGQRMVRLQIWIPILIWEGWGVKEIFLQSKERQQGFLAPFETLETEWYDKLNFIQAVKFLLNWENSLALPLIIMESIYLSIMQKTLLFYRTINYKPWKLMPQYTLLFAPFTDRSYIIFYFFFNFSRIPGSDFTSIIYYFSKISYFMFDRLITTVAVWGRWRG